ncbi:MAG: helix-turn-helix-domain containing protein AraC type [Segetibacter sp.]|nr:helix-turn-helix-domain containing protein AraC type [Segetibacter sp.]
MLINSTQQAAVFFHQAFTPFYFAAPACFYLYINCFINKRKGLSRFEWLHFIPAILAFIHILPSLFLSSLNWNSLSQQLSENKQLFISEKSGIFPAYFNYLGRPALLLGYLFAAWFAVLTSKIFSARAAGDAGRKWIFFFLSGATFFQLIGFLPLIFKSPNDPLKNSFFLLFSCFVFLVMLVFVLHKPKVFYGYLFVAVNWDNDIKEVIDTVVAPGPLHKGVNLLPDQLVAYSSSMQQFMGTKTPFLDPDFQIVDLAGELNIPVHHCSFIINNVIGKNFRDWINGYRINYFIIEYPLKASKITIRAIASESGFKTLTTFYNAFKKETGLMPKAYFAQKNMPI